MSRKERSQALIALQTARLERFDRTRTIQWNFNGIFWSGIVVATAFLVTNKSSFSFSWLALVIVDIIFLVIHCFVINMIQSSLDYDKGKVAKYTLLAERELKINTLTDLEIESHISKANSEQARRTKNWLITQLG